MHDFEKAKIKQAIGVDVYDMLKDLKCVLAGGAITSIFTGKEVNDWDLYFTNREAVDEVVGNVFNVSEHEYISPFDLIANHVTDRSLLTKAKRTQAELQFIHYKVYTDVQDIFNSFDFQCCMGAFDFATEEFVFHENFFKDLASRTLTFNKNTDFPIVSALRVDKYREKGYKISKAQMLRILFAVVKKDYNSWEDVVSEVGGLYGIDPKELFDTEQPFSLDAVIDQLATVNPLENRVYTNKQYSLEQVVDTMYNAFTQNFRNWWNGLKPRNSWYNTKATSAEYSKYDEEQEYEVPDASVKEAWDEEAKKTSTNYF